MIRLFSLLLGASCTVGAGLPATVEAQRVAVRHSDGGMHVASPWMTTAAVETAEHLAAHYLPEQLLVRDSVVRRWSPRVTNPIRIWIQPARGLRGWQASFPAMARSALAEWTTVGLPVHFVEVADSAHAEVHVLWAEHLGHEESGRTVFWSSPKGWITRARVTLSTHDSDGRGQTPTSLRAVALHEFGHALGLGHASDAGNIMAAWVEVFELSAADRNTAVLLYQMPAGRVRAAEATQGRVEAGASTGRRPVRAP